MITRKTRSHENTKKNNLLRGFVFRGFVLMM